MGRVLRDHPRQPGPLGDRMSGDAAAQIADEIEARLIWPLEMLLGPDEALTRLRERAPGTARMMAAQLASGDDKLAAQTAIDLAVILPDAIPLLPLVGAMTTCGPIARRPSRRRVAAPRRGDDDLRISRASAGTSRRCCPS